MTKRAMLSTLTALLSVFMGSYSVHAQDSMLDGPSAKRYLECATGCQKSFYFSEQSDKTFAQLRTACIEGCSLVVDANMTAYQGCNSECKDLYPYRHGNNAEFAGFQKACIVGCRRVH